MIIWAGTSNRDVGMVIEHYPKVFMPRRKQEVETVPGRNGDILISTDSFENYEQPYDAFLDSKTLGGLKVAIPRISDWLLGNTGYQRLEDSYFPDVYRMAYYSGGAEFISMFNEYGEGTLTFNCAPEKYYKFGEKTVPVTRNMVLANPSSFDAYPLIKVTGSGNGAIIFNGLNFELKNMDGTWEIDVKQHRTYNGTVNKASNVVGTYETLKLGKLTTVSWSGGVSAIEIIPRWWTI